MSRSKIVVVGEPMVEFAPNASSAFELGFGGDVYSVSVYLKRLLDQPTHPDVQLMTAIGSDAFSEKFIADLASHKVDTSLVYQHPQKNIGLYLIHTDNSGERSFSYWRSDSAAKQVMAMAAEQPRIDDVPHTVFVSGITLAIFSPEAREQLFAWLKELKGKGASIVFDPNYRPRLWESQEVAQAAMTQAFSLSDIALPGIEDLEDLYGLATPAAATEYLQSLGVKEIVIKNGPDGVDLNVEGESSFVSITPIKDVVDTTAAGDSFNAGYLSSRMKGLSASESAQRASKVAGVVIQHAGAIVPEKEFFDALPSS